MANSLSTHELEQLRDACIALAERWQREAVAKVTPTERRFCRFMSRLLAHPAEKTTLVRLIDQSFRTQGNTRLVDQFCSVLEMRGIPEAFPALDRLLLQIFLWIGPWVPALAAPLVRFKTRFDTRQNIVAAERPALTRHLSGRRESRQRVNLNHLGEAVLGEDEAKRRLGQYLRYLADPDLDYISVKVSSIHSQLHPLAFTESLKEVNERLCQLYDACLQHRTTEGTPKFVNLDMEAYHDLELTAEAFMQCLDEPRFRELPAGIVLQAYLPDSRLWLQRLQEWAQARRKSGGAPVKVRIVKGANLAVERLESALEGWPNPVLPTKTLVDANFKQMLLDALTPESLDAVHIGVASHNLFDVAFTLNLLENRELREGVTLEMLEGMGTHLQRVLHAEACERGLLTLLYTPVVERSGFTSAVAYLVRRLDENTGPENFLSSLFDLDEASPGFRENQQRFCNALAEIGKLDDQPRRQQDRTTETNSDTEPIPVDGAMPFENEANTDWALPASRKWAESIRSEWTSPDFTTRAVNPFKGGRRRKRPTQVYGDLCGEGSERVYEITLAVEKDVPDVIGKAREAQPEWEALGLEGRHERLADAAARLRKHRGELIGSAASVCGKLFDETDAEVSEAIDFVEYYPRSLRTLLQSGNVQAAPLGTVLVISPWNFPVAIPVGGVAASLATGNTVLLKPSPFATPVAWEALRCFWESGVPENVLQLVPCENDEVAKSLAAHSGIDAVIFTGSTETGMRILQQNPDRRLFAETGGKNATIVTALADRDEAALDVVQSAFGHSGQKCSATSLLVLEKEVHDDPGFKEQLRDAVQSLKVGSPWKFESRVGPLTCPATEKLRSATELEPGESWLVLPELDTGGRWLTPAVKWGTRPGNRSHQTEFFGPILSVMKAEDLDDAIGMVNATGFGLTSGLQSLDMREQVHWTENIEAGNLYINRTTTGAIVQRQPFGGLKKSAIGAGAKAGGPNYVLQLLTLEETAPPLDGALAEDSPWLTATQGWEQEVPRRFGMDRAEIRKFRTALRSYLVQHGQHFSREHDYARLPGQDNRFRYRSVGHLGIWVHGGDTAFSILAMLAAARICGNRVSLLAAPDFDPALAKLLNSELSELLMREVTLRTVDDAQLAEAIPQLDRLRHSGQRTLPEAALHALAEQGQTAASAPPLLEGRFELLHYLREQSVCVNFHRFGNLGDREAAFYP